MNAKFFVFQLIALSVCLTSCSFNHFTLAEMKVALRIPKRENTTVIERLVVPVVLQHGLVRGYFEEENSLRVDRQIEHRRGDDPVQAELNRIREIVFVDSVDRLRSCKDVDRKYLALSVRIKGDTVTVSAEKTHPDFVALYHAIQHVLESEFGCQRVHVEMQEKTVLDFDPS